MDLLRYVPVSVMRWRLWKRTTFLVLCVLTVVVLVILQSNLNSNRANRRVNTVYKAEARTNDRGVVYNPGARTKDGGVVYNPGARTKDGGVVPSMGREVLHGDLRRLQSLLIVDDKKKLKTGRKSSNGNQLSFEDTQHQHGGDGEDSIRENKIEYRLVKETNVEKNDDKKGGRKSHDVVEDINVNKTKHEKYNADEKENEALMEQLYKLLLKLENEGMDVNLETKLKSGENVQDNEEHPFHQLQYPQRINVEKLVKTFAENGDLPSNPINKWKYKPIINPSNRCENSKNGIFLLFVVKTRPDNFVKRKTIRKTWADEKRFPNMRTVFSIGIPQDSNVFQKLKVESSKYKDILLMDYLDSYNNLTLKTTSGINWAVAHCSMAEFVVSVDDDMYVATDFLIQHLKDMPQAEAERLYHGHLYHNTKPIRHGKKGEWHSKWIITKEEYAFDTYPDYIFGGFVIMSMQTVIEISLAIPYTRPINMEDVYLGIVASRLGIVATNTDLVDFYITYSNVEKFKTLIASHYYTSSHMLKKAWECHLSMVESDVEKSVFCLYLKTELEQLKNKIDGILDWINTSDNAL